MQKQIEPLAKARGELAKVAPSLSGSELNKQPGATIQYDEMNCKYNTLAGARRKALKATILTPRGYELRYDPTQRAGGRNSE